MIFDLLLFCVGLILVIAFFARMCYEEGIEYD